MIASAGDIAPPSGSALATARGMTPLQLRTVLFCIALSLLDGFDVLSLSFAAPAIGRDWRLSPVQLGLVFSIGAATLIAGAVLVAPFADRVGRRPLALGSLAAVVLGMAGASLSPDMPWLAAARALTGLGLGASIPIMNTIVAEYTPRGARSLAIALQAVGFPAGAMISGLASVTLLASYGWRAIFWFGVAASASALLVGLAILPESPAFLASARAAAGDGMPGPARRARLDCGYVGITIVVTAAYLLVTISNYFILSWLPKLLTDSGLSMNLGLSGAVLLNLGGMLGSLLAGILAHRFGAVRAAAVSMLACFLGNAAFGYWVVGGPALAAGCFVLGILAYATAASNFVILPVLYPPAVLASGSGIVYGIARVGSILGPTLGAAAMARLGRGALFTSMAVPMLVAAGLVLLLPRLLRAVPATVAPDR